MVESLILTTFILSSIIGLVCLTSNLPRNQKIYLSAFFIFIALNAGMKYLLTSYVTIFRSFPSLLIVPDLIAILIPEIIYLLVLNLLNKTISKELYLYLLILPLVVVVFFMGFYTVTDGFTSENKFKLFEMYLGLKILTFTAHVLFFVFCLREISKALSPDIYNLGKHNHIMLVWIKWLLWLLLIRAVFSMVFFTMQIFFQNAGWFHIALEIQLVLVSIIMLMAISLTAYYGLRNPMLFETITETPTVEQTLAISILAPETKKDIKRTLKEEDIEPYLEKIKRIVEENKLFLDSDLTPSILAQKVGMPVYKLTLALNKGAGRNFNEFLNYYRINYAKDLLSDPQNMKLTIYAIALESGFSSEAPFYSAFKKYVGTSPSAYRQVVDLKSNK